MASATTATPAAGVGLLPPSPAQTIGPYYAMALEYPDGPDVAPAGHPDTIVLHGGVYDGAGVPIPDALLEFWQLAPDGSVPGVPGSLRRDGLGFTGFGRVSANGAGRWRLRTLPPGAPAGGGLPHIAVTVFARGLLSNLFTRIYLPADAAEPERDPLLAGLPPEQRATLIAVAESERVFRFDIRLQGPGETVFLTYG
ncbi:MAG: protocatechuate 3,4-dioxygenase subunit alpha [Frankia sp.]|nr:protocatechuate 3,4-dioxygenase subunit alpha [Frankia sp.]